jgi:hypothetical protein
MDPDVILSPGSQPENNRNQLDSVGWLDSIRSDRVRYRIDGPE